MISDEKRLVLEAQIDYVLRDMIEHGKTRTLVSEGRVDYSHSSLYKFFVAPYKDVFKAVRLSLMDIGNSVRLVLSSLYASITRDKKWMIEAKIGFNERRQEINREWQPILERARDAIGGTDPIFRMALLGPSAFFTIEGLGLGLLAGKTAAEVLTGTGWERLTNNFRTNLSGEETLNKLRYRQREDIRQDKEFKKEIIDKLSKLEQLFFGKSLTFSSGQETEKKNESRKNSLNNLIVEKKKEEDKEGKRETSPEGAVKIWADGTGLTASLGKTALNFSKEISSFEIIRESALKRAGLMIEAASAESFEKFIEISKKINQAGGKINTSQIEAEFKKNSEEMFKERMKTLNQTPKKVSEANGSQQQQNQPTSAEIEQEKEKIKRALWQSMKVKTVNETVNALTEKGQDGKLIYDSAVSLDQKDLELMKKHKDQEVRNAAEIYENNKKLYNAIKEKASGLFKSPPSGAQ